MLEMLFSINGRVGRLAYWMSLLGFWVGVTIIAGVMGKEEGLPIMGIWLVVSLWSLIAIQVKRWHDIDKAGWWALINLIPIVGEIWSLIANGFLKGTEGTNRFDIIPIET